MKNPMPLISLALFALAALAPLSASAKTTMLQNQDDIYHRPPGGAVETVYGYDFTASVTVPDSVAPSTSYTISISKTLNMPYYNWWCMNTNTGAASGSDGQGCDSGNVGLGSVTVNGASQGYFGYGNNNITLSVVSGASGQDTISGHLGAAAGFTYGSNIWGGQYNYFSNPAWSVTVPIAPAPSVNVWFN